MIELLPAYAGVIPQQEGFRTTQCPAPRIRGGDPYKPFKVACGDTYWGIAKQLQEQGYRPRADIRIIVHELISKSGIKPHELKEGDTIYIPVMEGLE